MTKLGGLRPPAPVLVTALGAVALVTFPYWSRDWESSRYATTVLRDILLFAILALSLDLLMGYVGLPSLGHAAFFGAGAYAAAIASQRLGTEALYITLPAGVLAATVLAVAIGLFAVRASGIFFLMLTLAFAQMVFSFAFQATDITGGSNGFAGVRRPELFGMSFGAAEELFVLVAVCFLASTALLWRITRSPYGRTLVAIRENERRMRALGYDTGRIKLTAFALAGAIGGLAGALSAYSFRFVSPNDAGIGTSITAFVMVLIGGAGTLFGPAIGAAVVILIERVLNSYIPFSQTVLGVVFVAFVLAARQGIVGAARLAWARVRA
jgi:branched-chain amino acid transport system permease protein